MLKITVGEDCGNAPKKILLRDFNIAFAKNDVKLLLQNINDNIRWNIVGDKLIEGKDQFAKAVESMKQPKTVELTIENILTHGNGGATDGVIKREDGSSYAFCDVYRFSSNAKDAKIKEITSYVIKL